MSSKMPPSNLVSLPSLSSSLNQLPQATSLQNIPLHPTMYAQRAAESEAKLQKALSKTATAIAQNQRQTPAYMMPPPPAPSQGSASPLMMRPKKS